jgi:hypothetical protein
MGVLPFWCFWCERVRGRRKQEWTVDVGCVDCLLMHAAQGDCSTCLHVACGAGHLDVVKYLCERGGNELLMKLRYVRTVMVLYVCMCLPVWFVALQWDVSMMVLAYACAYQQTKCLCVCILIWMHM